MDFNAIMNRDSSLMSYTKSLVLKWGLKSFCWQSFNRISAFFGDELVKAIESGVSIRLFGCIYCSENW